jgi:ADP-ribose pyrophosphatase YjhB (NUDIX family)
VSAAVCVEKDGKLMLVKRGIEPWKGCWHMPAGYLEVDEDPKACAVREVYEETGFRVQIDKLIDVYVYDDDPRGNGIVLLYEGEITGGKVSENHETLEVGFFNAEECSQLPRSGSGGERQIEDWIARTKRLNS